MKIVSAVLVLFLLVGCLFNYKLDARVAITDVKLEGSASLRVSYTLTNTGNVTIDYYRIVFQVTYEDGTIKTGSGSGTYVPPGRVVSSYTYIFVEANKPIREVKAVKLELLNYDYNLRTEIEIK